MSPRILEHVKYSKASKQKIERFVAVVEFCARIENCWNDNYNTWSAKKCHRCGMELELKIFIANVIVKMLADQ